MTIKEANGALDHLTKARDLTHGDIYYDICKVREKLINFIEREETEVKDEGQTY